MKKLLLLLSALIVTLSAAATYFHYTHEGQSLFYQTHSSEKRTCAVFRMTNQEGYVNGMVVIPDVVYNAIDSVAYTVTTIYTGACSWTGVTSVTLPHTVTTVPMGAFDCSSLTSLVFPKMTRIKGDGGWQSPCPNLKSITFNGKIDSIDSYAFGGCSIEKIIFTTATPFPASTDIFSSRSDDYDYDYDYDSYDKNNKTAKNSVFDNATLYIPQGSEEAFAAVSPWNLFKKVETFTPETNVDMTLSHSAIEINKNETAQLTINLEGRRVGSSFITVIFHDENGMQTYETCKIEVKDNTELAGEIQAAGHETGDDIYTIDGKLIKKAPTPDDIRALTPGLYIIGNRKILIR